MKARIKTAIRDAGCILTIGVDPAMYKGCGIAVIRYFPKSLKIEPIRTATFKPFRVLDVIDYLQGIQYFLGLSGDIVHAIGTESSYVGRYKSVPYAVGRCRGIVEGISSVLWPGIIMEAFKARQWRLWAFGSGSITKNQALLTAQSDFNDSLYPEAECIGKWTEDAAEAYHIARACAIKLTEE